jgi:circadian clock protein KaiC
MRVLKYRGSSHGSNEYPFLIDNKGFSVLPITSLGLTSNVSEERVCSGIPDLDDMLGGKGFFKGSTILVTGQAGTGKSSFGAAFVRAVCENGKRALFITFEESPSQIVRNMGSIGIDLEPYIKSMLLFISAERPTSYGLEMHLVSIHKLVNEFKPDVIIMDPISSLISLGESQEVRSMLVRLVDFFKMRGVTALFTDLMNWENPQKSALISSLADTWILLENAEANGETKRILRLVKSRGMPHSNQIREFQLSDDGIALTRPYIGPSGVLTGSARFAQEAREMAEEVTHSREIDFLKTQLEQERRKFEARIESEKSEFANKEKELKGRIEEESRQRDVLANNKRQMNQLRSRAIDGDDQDG